LRSGGLFHFLGREIDQFNVDDFSADFTRLHHLVKIHDLRVGPLRVKKRMKGRSVFVFEGSLVFFGKCFLCLGPGEQGRGSGQEKCESEKFCLHSAQVDGEPPATAFAWLKINGTDIGVYSVHLKSNLILYGDKDAEMATDIRKREIAATQLISHINGVVAKAMPMVTGFVIGGDLNTNQDQNEFGAEKTQSTLVDAGFHSSFEGVPQVLRVTHPGEGKYPDATFDYLFGKNVTLGTPAITKSEVSDHYPLTCDVEVQSPFMAGGTPTLKNQATDIRVWVNYPTHQYFKPGMLLYGKTRDGAFMKESEALQNGFRPAGAK
jgi:hypothetical protein